MKNKKNAFTLIELIATIGLLGMISTIIITVSVRKINETKERARETMISAIELAAEKYVLDYKDELVEFDNNDYIYITLQTLVEKQYFEDSLVDPTTKKSLPLSHEVYVIREINGKIKATYDINQKEKTKIVLNGSYNQYIKQGETYTDLGITATSSTGADVSNNVVIEGNVNTLTEGTYTIKYKYDDITIERKVIVYKDNLPSKEELYTAVNYIKEKALESNSGLVWHLPVIIEESSNPLYGGTTTSKVINIGIRYVGSNPSNKVYFNCAPSDGKTNYGKNNYNYKDNCEIWRIIGVLEVDDGTGTTEERLKIVRDSFVTTKEWHTSMGAIHNHWGETMTTSGENYGVASLNEYLNGEYYNELSSIAKNQIRDAQWYTGLVTNGTPLEVLDQEMNNSTNAENTTIKYKTKWVGKVGLISTSDFGYAFENYENTDIICTTISRCSENWLNVKSHYWTMSAFASQSTHAWCIGDGYAFIDYVGNKGNVRPSVFLKSNVRIASGNGNTEPYVLK